MFFLLSTFYFSYLKRFTLSYTISSRISQVLPIFSHSFPYTTSYSFPVLPFINFLFLVSQTVYPQLCHFLSYFTSFPIFSQCPLHTFLFFACSPLHHISVSHLSNVYPYLSHFLWHFTSFLRLPVSLLLSFRSCLTIFLGR